ncbi:GAF domain-containing sensor histidine kinase [Neptunicoccus cionae]|uniref:histidine kinase n=1 Tax=Neptunicoccus cionae TaxID=2035344 RepID=A0A916QRA3_9RHOB|nr:GAF domain-containing sensor histidine kinase [Amylibacter cionae]GGA06387.1 sensor histidine kinase [Amylibacter cionae]
MRTYPIPFNEEARIRAVYAVPGLQEANTAVFDAICEATRRLLDCPIAHISVVEEDTQWYKSVVGIELERMPKNNSFCTHTIMSGAPMVIPDLSKDPRFETHPMVAEGGPGARFYAGVPLVLSSGQRFGSLCGLDLVPHDAPSEKQMAILEDLGKAVVAALENVPPKPVEQSEDQSIQSTFITLVGHELRTPLTILMGSMQLLQKTMTKGINNSLITSAAKSAKHLKGLVEKVIEFSDVSTGELRLNEQSCDLKSLLEDAASMVLPGQEGQLKTISCDPDAFLAPVLIDADQIKIALNALALNAINHGGTEITVGSRLDTAGNLEITITDNGKLDESVELNALYQPFVVGGDLDHRDAKGGLGLGLPLTRKLVELHGGEFEVRTDAASTCAIIRLPAWRLKAVEVPAAHLMETAPAAAASLP